MKKLLFNASLALFIYLFLSCTLSGTNNKNDNKDKKKPIVTISYPSNNLTVNQKNITVTGTSTDNDIVKEVSVSLNSGSFSKTTGINPWSITINLNEGINIIKAKAVDNSDNTSAIITIDIILDTNPPSIPVVNCSDYSNKAKPTWNWNVPNSTVNFKYQLDSTADNIWIETLDASTISFTPTENLSEGSHTLYVKAKDSSDNWSNSGFKTTIIDTNKPDIPIVSGIITGTVNTNQTFTITGENNATIEYSINNGSTWNIYSSQVELSSSGTYDIIARQIDLAGNISDYSSLISITIDKTPPNSISLYTKNYDNKVNLSWTQSTAPDFNKIEIYRKTNSFNSDGSITGMDLIFTGTNQTSFDDTNVIQMDKYYYVSVVYDILGNNSISSISYSFFPYLDMRNLLSEFLEDIGLAYNNNCIYLLSGRTSSSISKKVYKYDLATDIISQITTMPINMYQFEKCNVYNDRIYIFGGNNSYSLFDNAYSYDITNNLWSSETTIPYKATGIQLELYNGEIYLIAGLIAGPNVFTNSCMKYTISNKSYTTLTSKPTVSESYGSELYNDKIYIFSDYNGNTIVEIYDITNNDWTTGNPLNTERSDFAYARVQDKIYLIGGTDSNTTTARIDEYDITQNSWARKSDLALPRYGITGIAVNSEIYLIGGRNSSYLDGTIKVYRPLNDN